MKDLSLFQIALIAISLFIAAGGMVAFVTFQAGKMQTTTLNIWTDLDNAELWTYVKESEIDAAVEVEIRRFRPEDFVATVISELSLGRYPDIIVTETSNQLALGPRLRTIPLESLSEAQFKSTYVTGATSAFRVEEGYSGIPLAVDPLILYSNEGLLNRYGIPNVPRYWDEVSSIVNNYAKRSGVNVTQVIFPLGLADNVRVGEDIFATLLGQIGTQPLVLSESGRLQSGVTSDQAVQILSYYTDFANLNSGVYNWNANFSSDREVFGAEEAVFYIDYVSQVDEMRDLNPNVSVLYSEIPQIRGNDKYTHAKFYGIYFPTAAQTTAVAVNYATQLSLDGEFNRLLQNLYLMSAVRQFIDTRASDPLFNAAARSALYAGTWPKPDVGATKNAFSDLIANVLFRGVGAKSALSEYGKALTSI